MGRLVSGGTGRMGDDPGLGRRLNSIKRGGPCQPSSFPPSLVTNKMFTHATIGHSCEAETVLDHSAPAGRVDFQQTGFIDVETCP
jgi:hypothetical protein